MSAYGTFGIPISKIYDQACAARIGTETYKPFLA
jgi:hypothetical protein